MTKHKLQHKVAPAHTIFRDPEKFRKTFDLIGSPLLDPTPRTQFTSYAATDKKEVTESLLEFGERVERTSAKAKKDLPWVKIAMFGEQRTAKRSLRHDANMKTIHGIEGDYDEGFMPPDEAAERLDKAGIAGLVYTSPSHTPETPRWRVVLPTSEALSPEKRDALTARLNGALGGVLSGESFTRSQSYYFGGVEGNPPPDVIYIHGEHIDKLDNLDAGAIGRPSRTGAEGQAKGTLDVEAAEQAIRNGEAIHPSMMALAGYWSKCGAKAIEIAERLRALMLECENQDERWQQRFDDIPRCIGDVMGERAEEEIIAEDYLSDEDVRGGDIDEGFRLLTPEDCIGFEPPETIVDGMITTGDVCAIVGPPGTGKTNAAVAMGHAVAQGREFCGIECEKGIVLYAPGEDIPGIQKRAWALHNRYGPAPDFKIIAGLSDIYNAPVAGEYAPQFGKLLRTVKDERPSMVIFDTLAALCPGMEENKQEAMGWAMHLFRKIASHGCAVVVLHHDAKSGDGLPRGSSVLQGALDMSLALSKKDGGVIVGQMSKNRNGPCDTSVAFKIKSAYLADDKKGRPITAAMIEECDPSEGKVSGGMPRLPKNAWAVFCELFVDTPEGVSRKDWRDTCRERLCLTSSEDSATQRRTFNRAVNALIDMGKIETQDGLFVPVDVYDELLEGDDE